MKIKEKMSVDEFVPLQTANVLTEEIVIDCVCRLGRCNAKKFILLILLICLKLKLKS